MILTRPVKNTEQQLRDKAEVKELVEFERFCRDNALWEEMDACFAEDSRVEISWFRGSGKAFVEASKGMQGRAPHKIYNTCIWVNGDKAVAIMQVTIEKRTEIGDYPVDLKSDAKLVFRTVKRDGLWSIVFMQAIYEQDALVPVYPGAFVALPDDALTAFRESYACLSYVLHEEGYEIDGELPGIDRPEKVDALYAEVDAWLRG